jgi:type IV pilus assembly protein PilC
MARKPAPAKRSAKPIKEETVYIWVGIDKRGTRVKGELRGANPNLVKNEIRRQGINPLSVKKKPKALFSFGDSITPKDIMLFTRQLYTMLTAGIPIVQALDMISQSGKKEKLQTLIKQIKVEVESGTNLASALRQHHYYFDDLYCNLVESGEEAGVLESVLGRIAVYLEKIEAIKAKIKKALLYPGIVLLVAFVVTAFILLFVIPVFEDLFKSFGAELPAFTRMVLDISHFFQTYWWLVFGTLILAIIAFQQLRRRSSKFQAGFDIFLLRLPIFGKIMHLSATARFARTLATMFESGVPLVDALESVSKATGSGVYEKAVLEARDAVSIGQQLNFAMRQTNLFDQMVIQMVAIGEDSGSLGDMLSKVADFYEEELDSVISALTTLIEPLLMCFLAVIVGSLIIAMYLPIFKLGLAI